MITSINLLGYSWLEYFSYAVVQNTIFLSIIFLLLYLLRHADARLNYAVSTLGLLKLLTPPFLPLTFQIAPAATTTYAMSAEFSVLPAEQTAPQLSFVGIILLVWCSTMILFVAFSLLATAQLKWRLRHAFRIDRMIIDDYHIDLYQSDGVTVPMSIGIRPKRIYVPSTWALLTPDQQNALLRHEVAHIKRWDGLFGVLQLSAQAIYFFHPLVWLLNERINEYREMACDDQAVERSNVTPLAYSRYLVHVAENMLPVWSGSSASALIKQRNKLYHRVNYLIKENLNMKIISKRKAWFIWSVLILLFLPLSWYCKSNETPKESAPTTEEQKESPAMVGKIWGQALDESGDPLPGANITLVGTSQGAATDKEGRYYIINVAPGVYNLECSFLGFANVLLQDVKVAANQSTQHNFKLKTVKMQGEEITVTPKGSESSTTSAPIFVAYDEPPSPVGGFAAIQSKVAYPEVAHKAGIEGRVTINVLIDEGGKVVDTKVLQSLGDSGCDEAAISAIKATQWTPAKQKGKPVKVWVGIPVVFKLSDGQKAESPAPPPPPPDAPPVFVPYDEPPSPVGGFAAIQSKVAYPEVAHKAGVEGRVLINVLIDEGGKVVDTKVLKSLGDNGCDEAAIAAIKAVQWIPAKQRDKPVKVWVGIPIVFKLKE